MAFYMKRSSAESEEDRMQRLRVAVELGKKAASRLRDIRRYDQDTNPDRHSETLEGRNKAADLEFKDDYSPKITWDYCFAFPRLPKDVTPENIEQHKNRRRIITALKNARLKLKKTNTDKEIFVKVSAPQGVLEELAERMELQMLLKEQYGGGFDKFTRITKHRFEGAGSRFFKSGERIQIVKFAIEAERRYGGAELHDLSDMLQKGELLGVFPLHEKRSQQWLIQNWALAFFKPQPLDKVEEYFGARIAMYFAFLGAYCKWLTYVTVLGIIAAGFVYTDRAPPARVVTLDGDEQIVRPLSYDGPATLFYNLVLAVGVTLFIELWGRQEAVCCYTWNQQDYVSKERTRPEYIGKLKKGFWSEENDWVSLDNIDAEAHGYPEISVTDKYSQHSRGKAAAVWSFIATLMVMVVATAVSLLTFRAYMRRTAGEQIAGIVGGLAFAVTINVYGFLYIKIARFLNDRENFRTDSLYEDSLIAKVYLFQFVNNYVSFFWIAFVKNAEVELFGRKEVCMSTVPGNPGSPPNCMQELNRQLGSVFISQIFIGNIIEVVIPYLKRQFKKFQAMRRQAMLGDADVRRTTRVEQEFHLVEYESPFDDYCELVIQFGFISIFAAAFPLAPLFALINNLVEIRSDAYKILTSYRRPEFLGAQGIGTWKAIMEIVSVVSVVTNMMILCFTSTFLDRWVERNEFKHPIFAKFMLCVVVEHGIFFVKWLMSTLIPDVPKSIRRKVARQDKLLELAEERERMINLVSSNNDELQPGDAELGLGYVTEKTEDESDYGE
eukprot:tig00000241_g20975.t1